MRSVQEALGSAALDFRGLEIQLWRARLTHLRSRLWLKLRESMRWVQKCRGKRVRGEKREGGQGVSQGWMCHFVPFPSRLLTPPGGSA